MDYNVVIIRFGEMNTKGKNKKDFINTLARSIKEALLDYKDLIEYSVRHDHIYLFLKEDNLDIVDKLKEVSGLYSFSLAKRIDPDFDNIINESLENIKKETGKTFKIYTHQIDKSFCTAKETIKKQTKNPPKKTTYRMGENLCK